MLHSKTIQFLKYYLAIALLLNVESCTSTDDKMPINKNTSGYFSIVNTKWKYHVYRYFNHTQPDSGWFEYKDLKRQIIFKPNGILENVYFNDSTKSYCKTYGTWMYNDTMFEAVFYKDAYWKYRNSTDSVKLIGKIGEISESYIYICPRKFSKQDWVNFIVLTRDETKVNLK